MLHFFSMPLRPNAGHGLLILDLCHLQHKVIDFYNRDEKCLQRGTDWAFK
jgi:hypothetical protein